MWSTYNAVNVHLVTCSVVFPPGNHNCGRLPHPLRVEPGEPQERAEDGVALPGQLLHAVVQRAELPRGVREVDVRQHDRRQRQRG